MATNSDAAVYDSLLQAQTAFCMQVHAWVSAMSLKSKTVQPWKTLRHHPVVTGRVRRSKRTQTTNLPAPSKKLSLTPAAGKSALSKLSNKAAVGRSNQKQRSLIVAPHASASSLLRLPHIASLQDGLCPETAAQQAASDFSIGHIHSVLAVGTSGPVFHAR